MYQKIKKIGIEIFITLIGSLIMAAGISFFLLPNQLSTGGFSGIATILYYLFEVPVRKNNNNFKHTIVHFYNF